MSIFSKAVAALSVLLALCQAPSAFAAFVAPDLGDAAAYTLLAIPDGSDAPTLAVSSDSDVVGQLGVGPGGFYNKSGSGDVTGNVILASTATSLNTGSGNPGNLQSGDLTSAIADALAASNAIALAALDPPTQSFANITSTDTITGISGVSLFAVGDLNLGGSDILTLQGAATDFFIFHVTGVLNLSGSSKIVTSGGLLPQNVLFHVPTTGGDIIVSASSEAVGTFLAPHRDFTLHGALVQGRVIANDIGVTSGGEFFAFPPQPGPEPQPQPEPVIPEPGTALLLGLGLLPLARRRS